MDHMDKIDYIYEDTIRDRAWIIERLKSKTAGVNEIKRFFGRGMLTYAKKPFTCNVKKAINEEVLCNMDKILNSYVNLLDEKLYRVNKEKIEEHKEEFKKNYPSVENINFSNKKRIKTEEFNPPCVSVWLIPFSLGSLFVPNGKIVCLVGLIMYLFISILERREIKRQISNYIDCLDEELKNFTTNYCKDYEENLDRAIELCQAA